MEETTEDEEVEDEDEDEDESESDETEVDVLVVDEVVGFVDVLVKAGVGLLVVVVVTWFTGEVVVVGTLGGRVVVVGPTELVEVVKSVGGVVDASVVNNDPSPPPSLGGGKKLVRVNSG